MEEDVEERAWLAGSWLVVAKPSSSLRERLIKE